MAADKCPKCGKELSPFYMKATCPKCGTNLMYFEMEQRLQQDEVNAAKEVEKMRQLNLGIKASSIGSVFPIFRLISYILVIAATVLPVFSVKTTPFGLIQLIGELTAENADIMSVLFGSSASICITAFFVGTVLLSLISLVVSLFSYTKNGLIRNIIFNVISLLIAVVPSVYLIINGGIILNAGFYVIIALEIVILAFNILIDKKLK